MTLKSSAAWALHSSYVHVTAEGNKKDPQAAPFMNHFALQV